MKQYIINACTNEIFRGNQAAVCVMDLWPAEDVMLNITRENNFSETAFIVKEGARYHLRWFTPGGEIDLCGHATLASAYVLLNCCGNGEDRVVFDTLSGELIVNRRGDLFEMEFPAYDLKKIDVTNEMADAIGFMPTEAYMGRDLLCVMDDREKVVNAAPDIEKVMQLDGLLLHITAKNDVTDCVSRSFAPKLDIVEDPVCGSGHCHIAPYWGRVLGKKEITAYQASKRGGELHCRLDGNKVFISGAAPLFSVCDLNIDI